MDEVTNTAPELEPVEAPVEQQEQAPESTPQEPSIEDVAREQGWKPKEEYEGDPSKWVSAETFVAKGELIEKIEALGRELKTQKKANQMLLEHHEKMKQSEFKRAVEFLKAQKKAAYEQGDVDRIIELDEQLATVRETQKLQGEATIVDDEPQVHPNFTAWVRENKWYEADKELREEADTLGLTHAQRNPNKTPEQVLEYVSKQIRRLYPEKFTNPNRTKPSTVEGGSTSSGGKRSDNLELTDEEKQVMNNFVRAGIMSKEDYIKELKAMKGIK